jgi:hypothetical protein
VTDFPEADEQGSADPRSPGVSPGTLLVFLALPGSGLLLLVMVLGPGILLAIGSLGLLVAIPVLGSRLFGPRGGGAS